MSNEQRLRERSNIYERALQRSIMLKSSSGERGAKLAEASSLGNNRGVGRLPGRHSQLPTMQEDYYPMSDEDQGWETKMVKRHGLQDSTDQLQESRHADPPAPRDGIFNVLQDVMKQ